MDNGQNNLQSSETEIAALEQRFRDSIETYAYNHSMVAPAQSDSSDLGLADSDDDCDHGRGTGARMVDGAAIRTWLLAGNAIFTVVSIRTSQRFTFRVKKNKNKKYRATHWIALLKGPDNTRSYTNLGALYSRQAGHTYFHNDRATISATAPSARAMAFVAQQIIGRGHMPDGMEFWHEGCCGRCGRALTVPESIASGYGPECIGKVMG